MSGQSTRGSAQRVPRQFSDADLIAELELPPPTSSSELQKPWLEDLIQSAGRLEVASASRKPQWPWLQILVWLMIIGMHWALVHWLPWSHPMPVALNEDDALTIWFVDPEVATLDGQSVLSTTASTSALAAYTNEDALIASQPRHERASPSSNRATVQAGRTHAASKAEVAFVDAKAPSQASTPTVAQLDPPIFKMDGSVAFLQQQADSFATNTNASEKLPAIRMIGEPPPELAIWKKAHAVEYQTTIFDSMWAPDQENLLNEIVRKNTKEFTLKNRWGKKFKCSRLLLVVVCAW